MGILTFIIDNILINAAMVLGLVALLGPVSYTHLDVYKRQAPLPLPSGSPHICFSWQTKKQITAARHYLNA